MTSPVPTTPRGGDRDAPRPRPGSQAWRRAALLLPFVLLAAGAARLGLLVTGRDLGDDAQVLLSGRLAPVGAAPLQVRLSRAAVHPLGELRLSGVALQGGALPAAVTLTLGQVRVEFVVAAAARGRLLLRGAVATEARLHGAGPQWGGSAARLTLHRQDGGLRLTGQGLRLWLQPTADHESRPGAAAADPPGEAPPRYLLEVDTAGAQLAGGVVRRAAISGVRLSGLGPAQLLWGQDPGGLMRFRGELAGAQLRGVLGEEGLEARLDLQRFRAPLWQTDALDLRRTQLSGGLHVLAFREGGRAEGLVGLGGFTALTAEGRVQASGLSLFHPGLSAVPLHQLDVALEGSLAVERTPRGALRLESSGLSLHLHDIHASLAGAFTPQPGAAWRLDLDFALRELDCSAFLRSLPRALVPKLDGLGVSGRMGGRLTLSADSRLLPVLRLQNQLLLGCRVLRDPPLAAVQDLLKPRLFLERPGADGALRRLPLSAGEPTVDREGRSGPAAVEDGQRFVALADLPWPVQRAFLVAEDNLFYVHQGFDETMIIRALGLDLQDQQAARGASTISQQVAKNLWLGPERSLGRKLEEMVLTWRLEQVVPKARILEVYLNLVELGSGIYGIGAAAQHYFRVPAEELTRDQAAQLAALLPAPRRGMDGAWARRYRELLPRLARVTIPKAPEE